MSRSIAWLLGACFRILAIGAAFGAGWAAYMAGVLLMPSGGFVALLLQPFVGAAVAALFVAAALMAGLVLRIPSLRRLWRRSVVPALLVATAGLLVLCSGFHLGLVAAGTDGETSGRFPMLHPAAALGGYGALIFGIAHCPPPWVGIRRRRRVLAVILSRPAPRLSAARADRGGR